MSYKYGFFDAVDLGNGNYDRVYSSAEFSHYWALLVGDGVFGQPSTSLNVLATTPVSMSIKVLPGTGWIKGHYLTIPDSMDESIAIPVANPSLPRIDSIIMALDNNGRDMKLYVRSGTAAASPQAVTLQRDADVWELELAQITVAAGAGNITQQAIKDMRTDPNRCGIVTGLIDQFDVSGFFTAAQASFNEWFENVQGQLDGDVAGNLQNQINKNAAGIATINATTLKADTKTALGLPASAGPDDAFKVLAHVGNLHVWERVQSGVTDYITSTDRNAYTDGTVDNTTITYLGHLGEPSARIEVGSYVGTGTYGSSNKNKLTFKFEPKLLIIRNKVSSNEMLFLSVVKSGRYVSFSLGSSGGSYTGVITLSGNTVSWYAGGEMAQMNASKTTYNHIAIG